MVPSVLLGGLCSWMIFGNENSPTVHADDGICCFEILNMMV